MLGIAQQYPASVPKQYIAAINELIGIDVVLDQFPHIASRQPGAKQPNTIHRGDNGNRRSGGERLEELAPGSHLTLLVSAAALIGGVGSPFLGSLIRGAALLIALLDLAYGLAGAARTHLVNVFGSAVGFGTFFLVIANPGSALHNRG